MSFGWKDLFGKLAIFSLFGDDAMERIGIEIHFIPEDSWIVERREQATPYIIQELHKI